MPGPVDALAEHGLDAGRHLRRFLHYSKILQWRRVSSSGSSCPRSSLPSGALLSWRPRPSHSDRWRCWQWWPFWSRPAPWARCCCAQDNVPAENQLSPPCRHRRLYLSADLPGAAARELSGGLRHSDGHPAARRYRRRRAAIEVMAWSVLLAAHPAPKAKSPRSPCWSSCWACIGIVPAARIKRRRLGHAPGNTG